MRSISGTVKRWTTPNFGELCTTLCTRIGINLGYFPLKPYAARFYEVAERAGFEPAVLIHMVQGSS